VSERDDVDFMVVPGPGDGEHVSLTRLTDGRVMCGICCEYRWPEELYLDADNQRWDVCAGECARLAGWGC
jgi:hypothetical protein